MNVPFSHLKINMTIVFFIYHYRLNFSISWVVCREWFVIAFTGLWNYLLNAILLSSGLKAMQSSHVSIESRVSVQSREYVPPNTRQFIYRWLITRGKFILFVFNYRERYKKPSWEMTIPENFRLSDDRIMKFVECLKPVVLLSMFNKLGSFQAATCLQQLALLRPDIVLPTLLERWGDLNLHLLNSLKPPLKRRNFCMSAA